MPYPICGCRALLEDGRERQAGRRGQALAKAGQGSPTYSLSMRPSQSIRCLQHARIHKRESQELGECEGCGDGSNPLDLSLDRLYEFLLLPTHPSPTSPRHRHTHLQLVDSTKSRLVAFMMHGREEKNETPAGCHSQPFPLDRYLRLVVPTD